jgi:hypothetical protein
VASAQLCAPCTCCCTACLSRLSRRAVPCDDLHGQHAAGSEPRHAEERPPHKVDQPGGCGVALGASPSARVCRRCQAATTKACTWPAVWCTAATRTC